MDTPARMLFDRALMPPRDKYGHCYHPDLDDRWTCDDNEEAFDREKFAAVGYEIAFVWFENDVTDERIDRYADQGDADVSDWNPTTPQGDGWIFCGIWDTEDMPVAFYVRPLQRA